MIYLYVFIILAFFTFYFDILQKNTGKLVIYILECLILILFMGVRFRVGGDSLRYEEKFIDLPTLSEILKYGTEELGYQPLWYLLNAIIKKYLDSFILFQIVHASFLNIAVFFTFNKYVQHKFTAVLLYYVCWYLYFSTEVLRESFSVVVFMLSFHYLIEKRYIKYYLLSIIAFLFHSSAGILFILPLILIFLSSSNKLLQLLGSVVIAFIFSYLIEDQLPALVSQNILNEHSLNALEKSINFRKYNIFGILKSFIYLLPTVLTLLAIRKSHYNNKINNSILTLYLTFQIVAMFYMPFGRFRNYFCILFIVVLTDLLYMQEKYNLNKKMVYLATLITIISRIDVYTVDTTRIFGGVKSHYYDLYIPYYSIFNPIIDNHREYCIQRQDFEND